MKEIEINGKKVKIESLKGYLEILENDSPKFQEMKEKNNSNIIEMYKMEIEEKEFRKERELILSKVKKMELIKGGDLKESILHIINHNPSLIESLFESLKGLRRGKSGRKVKGESNPSENLSIEVINSFIEERGERDEKGNYKIGVGSLVDQFGVSYPNLVKIENRGYQEIPNRKDKYLDKEFLGRKYSHSFHSFQGGNQWESLESYSKRLKGIKVKGKKLEKERIDSLMKENLKKGESIKEVEVLIK